MKLLITSMIFFLNFSTYAAEQKLKSKNKKSTKNSISSWTLGKISVESQQDLSEVTIRLNAKPDWTNYQIKDHGTFIQIDLPKTLVPNPGEFINGAGPLVQKVAAFQSPKNSAGVRVFLSEDAALVKKSLKHDLLGDRILISIDHKKLAEFVAKDPANTAVSSAENSVQQVIDSTEISNAIPAPANKIGKALDKASSLQFKNTKPLSKQLTNISIFSGVLLLGLAFFHIIRSRFKRTKQRKNSEKTLGEELKLISSHALAPKQKIQLIEVAGQKILLGVSPDGINYLTSIQEPTKPLTTPQPQHSPVRIQQSNAVSPSIEQPKRLTKKATLEKPYQNASKHTKAINPKSTIKKQPVAVRATQEHEPSMAINDVTRLIREKLKNLPAI